MGLVEHFLRKGVLNSVVEGLLPTLCEIASATVEPHSESKIGTPSYLKLAWVRGHVIIVCLFVHLPGLVVGNKPAAHLAIEYSKDGTRESLLQPRR